MGDKKNVKKNVSDVSANVDKKPKPKSTVKKTQATNKTVAPKKAQTQPKEVTSKKEIKVENKKENIVVGKEIRNQKNVSKDNETVSSIVKIVLGIVLIVFIGILLFKAFNKPEEEYVVTFDSNGGTRITDVVVKEDGKLEKPEDPTREGYIFDGWYYNDKLYDFDNPVTEDIKLEAKWVKAVSVTGVKLNKTSIKLNPGDTTTLVATIKPKDASNKSLIWESSNSDVVTVDKNGNVEAIKPGKATITVKTEDGEFTAKTKVTVVAEEIEEEEVAVTGVRVDKEVVTVKVGKTTKVTAIVLPSNATNKKVTWGSSNPSVAKVSSTGVITGAKEGTATITVKTEDGGYTETVIVTVIPTVKAESITIEGDSVGLEGESTTLTAIITPANTDDKTVTWKSSNEEVATVSTQGVVTFKSAGRVSITATTSNGKKATHEITVKEKYTVIFKADANDNNVISSYSVAEGTNVQELIEKFTVPTREDFKVIGWESLNGVEVTDSTTVTGDITYVAIWKATSIVVTNQTELENALADDYEKIILGNDIEVNKSIVVLRDVTIDGSEDEFAIIKEGNPSFVSGGDNYVVKVYGEDSIDVTFKDIKLTNAMGAMLVGDNATVTVDNVDVDGNIWGGIEVKDTTTSKLNVYGLEHESEINTKPTVWIDSAEGENATISVAESTELFSRKQNNQVHYYLTSENAKTRIEVTSESELEDALAGDYDVIVIASSFEVSKSIVIPRDVEIVGNTGTEEITLSDAATDNYIFKVYGNNFSPESINVIFDGLKLTSANAAILVGDYTDVTIASLDVSGNVWGGIEVKDIDGEGNAAVNVVLNVDSIVNDTEENTKPTIWVDNTEVENAIINVVGVTELYERKQKNQVHYYLTSENAKTRIEVTSESELETALANDYDVIVIASSFEVSKSIVIPRDVEIVGKNGTEEITLSDASIDLYIFKVYGNNFAPELIDVKFEDVTLTDAPAAILVGDYASVTVDSIDVSGNDLGGIEVKDTSTTELIVGDITNTSEVNEKPTVWVDNEEMYYALISVDGTTELFIRKQKNQVHYYLKEANTKTSIKVTDETSLLNALAGDYDIIELANNISVNSSVVISRNVVIDGGGNTIEKTGTPTYEPGGNNYVLKVYGNFQTGRLDVTIKNIKLTNAMGAMLVGENADVIVEDLDVNGNVWGGIEVKHTDTTSLAVNSISHTEETTTKPTVWVDEEENIYAAIISSILTEAKIDSKKQVFYYLDSNNIVVSSGVLSLARANVSEENKNIENEDTSVEDENLDENTENENLEDNVEDDSTNNSIEENSADSSENELESTIEDNSTESTNE